jgi:hypothetical protein
MKKLLLTLLIALSSLVSFTQPLYARAYEFHLGTIIDDDIRWARTPTYVDILVQINTGELIVYSEEHQVYQIGLIMGKHESTTVYKARDKHGNICWLFITGDDNGIDVAITIRYSDYAWMYICREVEP